MASSGFEHATFGLVAQLLNEVRYCVPLSEETFGQKLTRQFEEGYQSVQ
jgi:hypothetical protein